MTLDTNDQWAIAGALAGIVLVIFNPLTFQLMEFLTMKKGWIAEIDSEGKAKPTWFGVLLHTVVVFFLAFTVLSTIDWRCS